MQITDEIVKRVNNVKAQMDIWEGDLFEESKRIFNSVIDPEDEYDYVAFAVLHEGCFIENFKGMNFQLPKTKDVLEYIQKAEYPEDIPPKFYFMPWTASYGDKDYCVDFRRPAPPECAVNFLIDVLGDQYVYYFGV